ncbi:Ku70-binding family protein [Raphanus sativus]|uniref:Mitochondrial inner membrane protease ATP23 n=1 Tax=Raphanus sativus TaxID=3726 RepID=A0A6J0JGZ8_RAPSA|nr:mitochondrial inner membrane protease ATP23 [Raphanus sativus]XP_056855271.1 mitochondrial inner membrane protease ATP23 [Raphanus sativus]KAJ4869024.1 Ku70-binding family protein [Raphanus sativus]KAJ4886261.1 Ku70-binding family protein [Raphanus sativus]
MEEDAAAPNSGSDLNLGGKRGKSIEECQDMIQRSFRNPIVKYLMEQMEKSGCRVGDNFVKAVVCTGPVAGGFTKGRGITVCSNYLTIQDEVNQVVIHELIHAYDECRAKNLDWTNCAHHACSEIRAGHLSGDCHFKRELLRGFIKLRGHEQECIKRRVLKSLRGNPYCSEVAAKDAMEAVWDTCYNDTKPFDRAP